MSISVIKSTRNKIGSCIACSYLFYDVMEIKPTVFEITFGDIIVRVCESCKKELIQKLMGEGG